MNKKMILIIIIAVVLVGAAAAFFLLMPKEEKTFYYSPGEAFVTNVLDSDRLVKATITFAISQDASDDLGERNSEIRDYVVYVLRNQSEDQFKDPEMQNNVAAQILDGLNMLFPVEADERPMFLDVHFNDFVMQ